MKRYNGWSNYETWRVWLELFDGHTLSNFGIEGGNKKDWADALEEWTLDYIDANCGEQNLVGWLQAFVEDVNFEEIARHIAEE